MPTDFPYEYDSEVEFNTAGNSSMYIQNGWSNSEVWGRWTEAREAKLTIPLDVKTLESDSKLTLTAEIQAFVSAKHPYQSFVLKANGIQIGNGVFRLGEEAHEISAVIPSSLARVKSPLEITFLLENPISPAKLGMSEDRRMLGIGLRRLRISAPHS
jgi:phosphoglycerol transferase